MFERYTDRARQVIVLTRQAAAGMGHKEADTGHLLTGLIGEGGGVAFQALTALGITPERVTEAVLNRHPDGDVFPGGHRNFTPRLKTALELALREALLLGHNYIATEHLLLGLIREGNDTGALALADCASLPVVRSKVLELLGGYANAGDTPNAGPAARADPVGTLLPDVDAPLRRFEVTATAPAGDESLPRFRWVPGLLSGTCGQQTVVPMIVEARSRSHALEIAEGVVRELAEARGTVFTVTELCAQAVSLSVK